MAKDIRPNYETLQKKYNLPQFEEMNAFFDICEIDETNYLLLGIKLKITEKLDLISKTLSDILQPEQTTLTAIYEYKTFDDEQKKKVFDVYMKVMQMLRQAQFIALEENEKDQVTFIKEVYKKYKELLPKLKDIFKRIEESWHNKDSTYEYENYFG